jgi:sensor histidine kinase YesM
MKYSKWSTNKRITALSIQTKLLSVFLLTALLAFGVTVYMHASINQTLQVIEGVYTSNAGLTQVSDQLSGIQQSIKEYLDTKSTDALSNYYSYEQKYSEIIQTWNNRVIDNEAAIMEKNIRGISETYLELADLAVEARRARNIPEYMAAYQQAVILFDYLNAYIFSLNNLQFIENTESYGTLGASLELMSRLNTFVTVGTALFNLLLIFVLTRRVTQPLKHLSRAAHTVTEGDFSIPPLPVTSGDEIGVVTHTFNEMIVSIREYIVRIRESMEAENDAKERELLMANLLKDAQLKYYQAQIHPHFLFNTLNAGAQLAMMEDAEKTYSFIQKMSEFFRYSMNNLERMVYLQEEITLVENYIYIMNVRFSGEIYFEKDITCDIRDITVPGMILQPLVENAVQYGIRDITWQGKILLSIEEGDSHYRICVTDNGKGIEPERLKELTDGNYLSTERKDISNGIGLGNVRERLELTYNEKSSMLIESEGLDTGTSVSILIPKVYGA